MKKIRLAVATLLALCGAISLSACGEGGGAESSASSQAADENILAVYNAYVENGGTLSYEEWLESIKGEKGDKGDAGEAGNGIASIAKTGTEGNVDTYTITYTDGTTSTFTVTNGEDGSQGIQGEKGEDGHTPTITIGENGNWYIDGTDSGVSATGAAGAQGEKGDKGDKGDTGATGPAGADGKDGADGQDAPHAGETHTVTYHLNGGTMPDGYADSVTVNWGDVLDLPIPTLYGHDFNGWFTGDTVNDKQFYSTDAVFTDLNLYAKWSASAYTITLDLNGGTLNGESTGSVAVRYGEQYTLPSEGLIKGDVAFVGWFNGEEQWELTGTYTLTDNITLTAEWLITYPITADLNGGSVATEVAASITNKEIYEGTGLSVPAKTGFDFLGYYDGGMRLTDENGLVTNVGLLETSSNSIVARYVASDGSLDGDYFYFGEYPQTEVTDEALIANLASASDDDGDGYVDYDGKEYAKVVAKNNYYVRQNGFVAGTTYYFEVEPILWAVGTDGELVSSKLIDAKNFYLNSSDRTYQDATIYPNNYEYSDIRAFLNGYDGSAYQTGNYEDKGFYDLAFSSEEKLKIQETTVDNSAATTHYANNPYVCNDTVDNVYLLSFEEACSITGSEDSSPVRMKEATDYALINALPVNNTTSVGYWWLRSPYSYSTKYSSRVYYDGAVYNSFDAQWACGLVPALKVSVQ